MEMFPFYILAGAGVGFMVGLTGVGGGSLMTPLLLMFGIPPHVAIGTDLLYASATKVNAVYSHQRHKTIRWRIALTLLAGSLPASLATTLALRLLFPDADSYKHLLTNTLGIMLILTSVVLLLKRLLVNDPDALTPGKTGSFLHRHKRGMTFLTGILLGVFVTLSSVGAGAFGTAALMILYHRLPILNIIGSELAHAVPLTLVAGLGHFLVLGNVDLWLLAALLAGSMPATHLGAKFSTRIPEKVLYPILTTVLLLLGIKYSLPLLQQLLG